MRFNGDFATLKKEEAICWFVFVDQELSALESQLGRALCHGRDVLRAPQGAPTN